MYKYEIIETIKKQNPDAHTKLAMIGDFYTANLNLIKCIARKQCLTKDDYYDYLQLGYDALITAVDAYKLDSSFTFLSFFRRSFKHRIFMYNLEFQYPLRIKNPYVFKSYDVEFAHYGVFPTDSTLGKIDCYHRYDTECLYAENEIMSKSIINILKAELDKIQFFVIVSIFWQNKTKKKVASEMNLSFSNVRYIYTSALRRLRKNADLRHIASDMFGIST